MDPYRLFLDVCHYRQYEEKKLANIFSSPERLPFFQQPLRSWNYGLITSRVLIKIPFGPLEVVSWRFPCSIIREKIGQNLFFTGKIAFFFKNFCFQQPLGSCRKGLITSTAIVLILFGPVLIFPWGLSHSIVREKIGQNLFFTVKIAFFSIFFCFQQFLSS